jgi:DNA-binding transcriptional MocR family regulator
MGELPLSYVIQRLIARQLDADENIEVDPEAVVVTTGSQEALSPLGVQRRRARDVPPAVTPAGAGVTGAARLLGPPVHLVAKAPDGGDLADQRWRVHQVRAAGLGPRALYVVTGSPTCQLRNATVTDWAPLRWQTSIREVDRCRGKGGPATGAGC